MMKTAKRFLSMMLVLSLMLSLFASPALAASAKETAGSVGAVQQDVPVVQTGDAKEENETVAGSTAAPIIYSDEVIFGSKTLKVDLTGTADAASRDVEVDYDDPAIVMVEEELRDMKVLNDDGEQVALTDEQIAEVLGLYQQYLDHWDANTNVLGIQVPFFLAYNDNEDELGILGEMLALANKTVDQVRTGEYSFEDLRGMIQNFMYGDMLGVQYYGEAIAAARDEMMEVVKASGAQTDAQKLLVINDWLAHVNTFDMPYIMNADKAEDEKPMVAEDPVKFERYDDIYNAIYGDYEAQVSRQFHDAIYADVVADLRQTFYEQAIRQAIYNNAYESGITEAAKAEQFVNAAMEVYRQEKYEEALVTEEQRVYDEAYEEAYRDYLNNNCDHAELTVDVDWVEGDTTADATCANCGLVFADQAATVVKDADNSVAATCTEAGKNVYNATVNVVGDDGDALATVTDTKTETVAATGHTFVDGVCSVCGAEEAAAEENGSTDEIAEETTTVAVDDNLVSDAEAVAKSRAERAVSNSTEEIEAGAAAIADAAVAAMTDEEKAALAREQAEADEDTVAQVESEANAAADAFMKDNAAAIEEDALGFITASFGEEAAAQISAQCDGFIENAETNGVEVAEGVVMTVEQITQNTMANEKCINLGSEEEPYMVTPNDAVAVYADQAAQAMSTGVINYWEGSHFGALGFGTSVCLGYARAYNYLVQCAYPEVYGVDGAGTDMTVSENWKSREELYYDENGELDLDSGYMVDLVRITFDASVTMYGQTEDNFNSDHFWNAVKVDGKWYYVDPCYTDVFTEVMMRDRVETDGSVNHLYFLFSHTSCLELYDGYYQEIKTMYADLAVNQEYEDSWISRVKSNIYSDGSYFYYAYDSTDLITLLEESENSNSTEVEESQYKIVRHKIDTDDLQDGDSDYDTLIYFNYRESDDSDAIAVVYNPSSMATENNALLTELYARHEEYVQKYPSLAITTALYEGKLYFNLANCLLSYDLETGAVALVKEYNTVYGQRDKTQAFGGMAFSVVGSAAEADHTVENHPIAGMTVKDDGNLYVSIATNFAFISGKDPFDSADQSSYGYEFEETNYNSEYNSYNDYGGYTDEELESYGYTRETNDNDEFMWSANFVETLSMSHVAGTTHTYEAVTVEPHCGIDGYTENRCTDCGAIEAGSRVVSEGTALDHHYILFAEQYYTKDDAGRWNSGECYVCTICANAVSEPVEPQENDNYGSFGTSYEEQMEEYEKEKAIYDAAVASAGHHYVPTDATWTADGTTVIFSTLKCDNICPERKDTLDCLVEDDTVFVTLSGSVAANAQVVDYEGNCATGLVATYEASGEVEGYPYSTSKKVDIEAGKHAYNGTFEWTEVLDEDGVATGEYTATADVTCSVCGDTHEDLVATVVYDAENSTTSTCVDAGKDIYVATVVITDEDGNELGSATGTKEVTLELLPHDHVDGICSVCGDVLMSAPTILSCYSKLQTSVKVTWTEVNGVDGYELWRTTTPDDDESWARTKTMTSGDATIYTNQGLTEGVTYYYKVRAYIAGEDGSKVYSDFSNVDYMPAAVQFNGPYSNAPDAIRMRWNEIDGAHGYQIWRLNEDGTYSIVKTLGDKGNELTDNKGSVTAYTNTGLTSGEQYTYRMRAFMITEDGRKVFGAYSNDVTVAVMPVAPVATATSPKAGRAQLDWNAVSGAAGYQIWMSTSADADFSIVKSITDGTATSYTKYDLVSGETYYFKVRAYVEIDGKKTFGAFTEVIAVTIQ